MALARHPQHRRIVALREQGNAAVGDVRPPPPTSRAFPRPGAVLFTPLDLTTPADLQAFGFIPELIGRVHNICALSPLSLDELYRILTEPRNSLVSQYTSLFEAYPSKLFFTRRALYAIAERAANNETGARGLKMRWSVCSRNPCSTPRCRTC